MSRLTLGGFISCILVLGFVALCGCTTIGPDTDPTAGAPGTSEAEEARLGWQSDSLWRATRPVLLDDNPITLRVRALVESLAPFSDRPKLAYRTAVINDPRDINAFAGPGGYVYVTTGMLEFVGSADELALAVAHELGHISGRHAVRMIREHRTAGTGLHAARVFGSYLARGLSAYAPAQSGQLVELAVQRLVDASALYVTTLALTGYGLARENQADRLGMAYLKRQGQYDPAAALRLFRRFDLLEKRAARSPEDASAVYALANSLKAHPSNRDRIKQAEDQLGAMKLPKGPQDLPAAKVPEAFEMKKWPAKVGPEILAVRPEEAWFALCRLAATDPRIRTIVSCNRRDRSMKIAIATPGVSCCLLDIRIQRADPAGAEVTVSASSGNRGWWPTILMRRLKAEAGLVEYPCLDGIAPAAKSPCEDCRRLAGTQEQVYSCLRSSIPWVLVAKNDEAGFLGYAVGEGLRGIPTKIVVSPDSGGACRVYVGQGPMAAEGNPAVEWVFDLLKKEGHGPVGAP